MDAGKGCVEGEVILDAAMDEELVDTAEQMQGRMLRDKWSIWEAYIPQVLWSATPDGGLDFINSRWTEYSGQTLEEACPTGWVAAVHAEDVEHAVAVWGASLGNGNPYEVNFRLRRKDGAYRWFLARALAVRDDAGEIVHWYGTCTDIDDQKQSEAAMIRSEKLATAGRLSASIAHEINNPLEAVTNLLYLCRMDGLTEGEVDAYLKMAQAELVRVSEIVTQTLRFHRQPTKAERCKMPDLMAGVLALYDGRLRQAQIDVVTEFSEAVALECWGGEIRQVLANLIGNALDAMRPAGGTLRLRSRMATDWVTGAVGIRTTVADTGCGMPAEIVARMFEAFFTTKHDVGTGLGLWVSKGIVEKHDGRMRLRSAQGERHGTVFTVFWPLREGLLVHH